MVPKTATNPSSLSVFLRSVRWQLGTLISLRDVSPHAGNLPNPHCSHLRRWFSSPYTSASSPQRRARLSPQTIAPASCAGLADGEQQDWEPTSSPDAALPAEHPTQAGDLTSTSARLLATS